MNMKGNVGQIDIGQFAMRAMNPANIVTNTMALSVDTCGRIRSIYTSSDQQHCCCRRVTRPTTSLLGRRPRSLSCSAFTTRAPWRIIIIIIIIIIIASRYLVSAYSLGQNQSIFSVLNFLLYREADLEGTIPNNKFINLVTVHQPQKSVKVMSTTPA